jgi:hypothetical protein
MSDWIRGLPVGWMAVVVFGGTYVGTAAIYSLVMSLAVGERASHGRAPKERSMIGWAP